MLRLSCFVLLAVLFMTCGEPNATADQTTTTSETPAPKEVATEEVTYEGDSIQMKGFLAYPKNEIEKKPAVLVIHEWWGHNDYTRKRAKMLADLGYVALAVDMYGDGKTAEHPDDAGAFAGAVMSDLDGAKKRFETAYNLLKAHPGVAADKMAVIGYCFGGSVALSMANMGMDLDAVAVFHSGVQLPVGPEEGPLKAKVLVCNGADDPFISAESIAQFKAGMDAIEADYQYISYPGVTHGFTNPAADENGKKFDLPLAYDQAADEKSWLELQNLLESVF